MAKKKEMIDYKILLVHIALGFWSMMFWNIGNESMALLTSLAFSIMILIDFFSKM